MKSLKRNENLCYSTKKKCNSHSKLAVPGKKESHKVIQSITDDFFSLECSYARKWENKLMKHPIWFKLSPIV